MQEQIAALGSGKPVPVAAPVIKREKSAGPKVSQADIDRWNEAARKTDKQDKINTDLQKGLDALARLREDLHEVEIKLSVFVHQTDFLKLQNEFKSFNTYVETNKENISDL